MEVGIVSYGTHVPKHRIDIRQIFETWRNVTPEIFDKMSLSERVVLMPDEDTLSIGVNAGQLALDRSGISRDQIDALIFGTCTNPYQTKASATIAQDALGLRPNIFAYDLQFGTKSGTSAIINAAALVRSGMCRNVLIIGSDTINRHFPPGVLQEYSASAGAFAAVIGKDNLIAKLEGHASHSQDLSDYFRIEGERYMRLGGGWIGHVSNWGLMENAIPAGRELFGKLKIANPGEYFVAAATHQMNGIQPMMISGALKLNMTDAVMPYVLTPYIGDCGSASSLIPFAKILDWADPGQKIFVHSHGWGSGADCLSWETTNLLPEKKPEKNTVDEQVDNKIMVDYAKSLKWEYKMVRPDNMMSNYL